MMRNFKKTALIFAALAVITMIFTGCGKDKILGKWYETVGYFGSFEFFEDGTCVREFEGIAGTQTQKFTYEFNGKKGKLIELIEHSSGYTSDGDSIDFVYEDEQITLTNQNDFSMTLARDYVEETFIEDMQDLRDAAQKLLEKQFEAETGMTLDEAREAEE
jgi:hypothetical protein